MPAHAKRDTFKPAFSGANSGPAPPLLTVERSSPPTPVAHDTQHERRFAPPAEVPPRETLLHSIGRGASRRESMKVEPALLRMVDTAQLPFLEDAHACIASENRQPVDPRIALHRLDEPPRQRTRQGKVSKGVVYLETTDSPLACEHTRRVRARLQAWTERPRHRAEHQLAVLPLQVLKRISHAKKI